MVVIAKMLVAATDNCVRACLFPVGRLGWETDDTGTLPNTSYRGQGFPRELLRVTLCRVLRPFSTNSDPSGLSIMIHVPSVGQSCHLRVHDFLGLVLNTARWSIDQLIKCSPLGST